MDVILDRTRNPRESYVDAQSAAAFLAMPRRTLLDMARKGRLPGHPVGSGQRRMWKFRLSELEHWMQTEVNSSQRLRSYSRRIT
ncbi:MAG: helix-turn-helix domain-containing protein [Acidobacteria bacterium]|nr:helix-turn-helix domain-containing protein [Acidobacteriota bacterium]MBW4044722.1 helix-turn-helix domain-containing protein [Acidobacteriota bacterium]